MIASSVSCWVGQEVRRLVIQSNLFNVLPAPLFLLVVCVIGWDAPRTRDLAAVASDAATAASLLVGSSRLD
eukprot:CAMPEP_0168756854 /NCGR_PEP_ID=MMETSP0724-20121128/20843_1 /TAXON_ID=265536 /ORGANISM="Amphiprora sp., Strain CCMP467" /LENGTH=70 /DNA_ID=CAMNT_0008805601 /DNA_START=408 /DNA_END=617 /DNA_ORIENTATION=+